MRKPIGTIFTVALALSLSSRIVQASGPVSIYSLIEKVTFEPGSDPSKAERIRIEGVFIVATSQTAYRTPQPGVLEFTIPSTNQDLAHREWNDLASMAGTRQVVAFGSAWFTVVQVGKPGSLSTTPTAYPMGNGIARINSDQPRAKELLEYKGS